jgi:hypothetical protein
MSSSSIKWRNVKVSVIARLRMKYVEDCSLSSGIFFSDIVSILIGFVGGNADKDLGDDDDDNDGVDADA